MTIVNPLTSSNLVVQSAVTTARPEERQNNLRIEQIVRATVVEGGLDRVLLEMKHQKFWVQSEQKLQTGQQLELQVLTTHPKISFKLLTPPLENRLTTLLPLLAKPFNWNGLLQQIQQGITPQSEPMKLVLAQLSVLLRPKTEIPAKDLAGISAKLEQLKSSELLLSSQNGPRLAATFEQLISTINLRDDSLKLPQQLNEIAMQIRQQPEAMLKLIKIDQDKIADLLKQIENPQKPIEVEQARRLASELKALLSTNPSQLPHISERATRELQNIINPQLRMHKLSPAVLEHMKELTVQLQVAFTERTDWPQDLQERIQQILNRLQPLIAEPEILKQEGKLGILSQLLGLKLEAELLRGRTQDALSSLKLALLSEPGELGPKGEEALHRLELFQICRVRLAEQGITFVPLPLPFLEEGFLFIDEDGHQGQKDKSSGSTQLSVHLRLSSLGNLRIDVLSDSAGMLLRLACEDHQRLDFLKSISNLLQERLQQFDIRSINFTIGAESPAQILLKKILPNAHGMLDARV